MRLRDLFRPRSVTYDIALFLTANDILVTPAEVDEVFERARGAIEPGIALPEQQLFGCEIELEFKGGDSGYRLFLRSDLMETAEEITQRGKDLMELAMYYTAINELLRAKGVDDVALKPGERVGIDRDSLDPPDHLLHELMGALLLDLAEDE